MKKPRIQQDDAPAGLTHNPFAALRPPGAPPAQPPDAAQAKPAKPVDAQPTSGTAPRARILVQREKKGRGGKTVTRVAGLSMPARGLAELARDLKRALGCGASVDGVDLLLQGDLTRRAATWLRERFGADVTIGN